MIKNKQIYVDERWIGNHGIGTVTKNLIQGLKAKPLKIRCSKFSIINPFFFSLRLLFLNNNSIVINPGFNNPFIFPRRYFFYIHDLIHVNYYSSFFYKIYYKFYISFSVRYSSKVFTVSEFSRSQIIEFFKIPEYKVVNVSNGIDQLFFTKSISKSISKFKLNLNFDYFLCVANRKKHKNEMTVLKAFLKLIQFVRFKLILIGKPSIQQTNFLKKNNLTDHVIYLSDLSTSSMVSLYRNAKGFITASFVEGFNLPLVEAMASKIPIYASNIDTHREISKGNVFFFDPYNPESLYNKILTNFNKKDLTQINRAYLVAKSYSWDKVIKKIEDQF